MGRKPGKSPSHLIRIGTKYYYRRVISQALFARIGMREIKVTLKTSSLEEARRRSNIIESQVLSILAHVGSALKMEELSPEKIRMIVRDWLRKKIDEMENLRSMSYQNPVFLIGQSGRIETLSIEKRKESLLVESDMEKGILTGKSSGNTSIETMANVILSEAGIEVPPESLTYKRLCREMRKGFLNLVKKEVLHIEGCYEDYMDTSYDNLEQDATPQLKEQEKKPPKQRLGDLLEPYFKYKESENIKAKSLLEVKNKCSLFVEILGNPLLEQVDIEFLTEYKNSLRKIPSNASKKAKYRKKNIQQLLQMNIPEKDAMDITTVNNHLAKAKSFLLWLETFGYLQGKNLPSALKKIKESHRPFEEKDIFTVPELQIIFNHSDYLSFNHAWEFWLPLISLFSGMRIGEICRLRIQDIQEEEGLIFFDVTVTEKDQPKTQAGVRKIPVHDELLRLGLRDYARKMGRNGSRFLFPDRQNLKVSPSHYPVQRLNAWFKKIGVAKSGVKLGRKTFHSFRHTFETRCQELMLDQRLVDQIMGHSVDKKKESERYGKPAGILQLKREVIDKYHFVGLNLSGLCKSKHTF